MGSIFIYIGVVGLIFFLAYGFLKKDHNLEEKKVSKHKKAPDKLARVYEGLLLSPSLSDLKSAVKNGLKINTPLTSGYTLLLLAAELGSNVSTVRYLIENGADLHAITRDGMSALMLSAEKGNNAEVIRFLIQCGADTQVISEEGMTAFDYAKNNPNLTKADRELLKP